MQIGSSFLWKVQDRRSYKCFQPSGFTSLGGGLHCRTGKRDVPRLILAFCWKDRTCCAKACLFFRRTVEMWAGKVPVMLSAHLCWESKFAARSVTGAIFLAHCKCTLICLFLTTWENSVFVGFLFVCNGVDEPMWYDSIATIAEKPGRIAHFLQNTPSCSNIYLACWSSNVLCAAVTDFWYRSFARESILEYTVPAGFCKRRGIGEEDFSF